MLGERRSNSLFAPAAPAEPERKPEQAEVHDISFEERTGRSLFAETATAPRASELFFAPQEKGVTFAEALSQVQSYLSETYATLITEDNSDAKEQMKRRMARYLQENRIAVDGMTASELVDALYTEMAEYGFLTKYIFADGIEEIDINSWRDIEIQYSDGHTAKLEEHFDSPEHAANVIRRMLQNSGKVLDNASPIITSRLASLTASMRITPDSLSPTATAATMKSGYGIQEKVTARVTTTQSAAVTAAQNAVTYFPEFGYEGFWRLLNRSVSGKSTAFAFKNNHYSTYDRPTHFTPIWYPDGSYTPYTWLLDCWTPMGMLSMNLADSVRIAGDLWEEWHIAPSK